MKKSFALGLILLIAGVIGIIITFSGDDDLMDFGTTSVNMGETVAADAITDVSVKGSSVNVEIKRGTGSDIKVALEGRASEKFMDDIGLDVQTEGGKLIIQPKMPRGFSIGINIIDVKLRIELPERQWENVSVDVGSGNVALSDVHARTLALDAGSGNIEAERVEGTSVSLHSGSGDQRLSNVKATDEIQLDMGSGNATVDTFEAASLTFEASSGNVKLLDGSAKITGNVGSGNIRYETARLTQDVRLKTGSGNVGIELDEEPSSLKVEFRTGSGDSDIDWDGIKYDIKEEGDVSGQFGDGAVLLEVTTGSGNIDLERR
jgi:lia operon protein LiaG